MNKRFRQARIKDLVRDNEIETQDELVVMLRGMGIPATQATVSRDIRELGLTKIPLHNGRYVYALQERRTARPGLHILRDEVGEIDAAGNIVVVKTSRGSAPRVGEVLDALDIREIVGTVAGDDTVLVVVRCAEKAEEVVNHLYELMGE